MRQQPSAFEWHFFENGEVSEQAWATALSPATPVALDTYGGGYWRSGRGWYDLLVLIALVVALLWLHPWQRADATAPTQPSTTVDPSPKQPQTIIQPGWQPMMQGLQSYFRLCQQQDTVWSYISRHSLLRQQVSTLPLYAIFPDDMKYRAQVYHWSPAVQDDITLIIAGTFAEYVATTYGQERVSALLNGFSRYATWTELSPAVFGIPADELEAGWHTYLAKHAEHLLAAGRSQTNCMSR